MLNEKTQVSLFSGSVEYRNPTAHGTQVIEVIVGLGKSPYFKSECLWIESGRIHRSAISVPLDEIIEFCEDAVRRCTLETLGIQ